MRIFRPITNLWRLLQLIRVHQETIVQLEARLARLEANDERQENWNNHLMKWQILLETQVEGLKTWRSK